jgi:ribosomal-protein-alanine N-acetyltransferase
MTDVRRITDPADVHAAAELFDEMPRTDATLRFLEEPGHHLLLAYVDGEPVGLVTGVEMTHPDKGTEMFLYELGVDDAHRNRGIGRALTRALVEVARERGCYGMWVLTEDDNPAAVATYMSAGATSEPLTRLLAWDLRSDRADPPA